MFSAFGTVLNIKSARLSGLVRQLAFYVCSALANDEPRSKQIDESDLGPQKQHFVHARQFPAQATSAVH
jgi:hypothetical protein